MAKRFYKARERTRIPVPADLLRVYIREEHRKSQNNYSTMYVIYYDDIYIYVRAPVLTDYRHKLLREHITRVVRYNIFE